MLNQDQFVLKRQSQWQELSGILAQLDKSGPSRLSLETVERLGQLYRHAASDLAYARTYFPGSHTSHYLNQLVSRAHGAIYSEEPQRLRAILRFFAEEAPRTVRAARGAIALAVLLMAAGGLVAFWAVLFDPNLAQAIVPESVLDVTPGEQAGADWPLESRALIGTYIMLNNLRVGVLAFGLGITLGLGTGLILFFNGVLIGGLAAQFHRAGHSFAFWSLIVPHGVLELMAIFLCGAAGFAMGWPLVAPGDLTRREALAQGAIRAVRLVAVAVPFFVAAAFIEGWLTPAMAVGPWAKYAAGVLTGIIGLAYWALPGRAKAGPAP